jgi:formate/nitrite transporter
MASTTMTSSLILDPPMAAATLVSVAIKKCHLPTWKMVVLGILAGVYVSIGNQVLLALLAPGGAEGSWSAGNSTMYEPASGVLKFFGGAVFSTVLVIIIICGAELFTGNILIVMALWNGSVTLKEMLVDWFVVYFSNFAGIIFFTAIIFGSGQNGYYASVSVNDTHNLDKGLTRSGQQCCSLAAKKADMRPHEMFFSAIPANILVCIAVIMAIAAKSAIGKVAVCAFPIGIFVCCNYNHSIANMALFTMATLLHCNNGEKHGLYWLNLCLSTLGNIVGAAMLATAYYFMFVFDSPNEDLNHPHLAPSTEPTTAAAAETTTTSTGNNNNAGCSSNVVAVEKDNSKEMTIISNNNNNVQREEGRKTPAAASNSNVQNVNRHDE